MRNILGDELKSGIRLFWKNGGWVTLVIACTVVILLYIAFSTLVPALGQERIRNAGTDMFAAAASSSAESINSSLLNNTLKLTKMLSR